MVMSVADRIKSVVSIKYPTAERVLRCWDRFAAGDVFEATLDTKGEILQRADCYIEG